MTQQKPVVGVSEATTIFFILLSAKTFLFYAPPKYDAAMNAAWMIPFIQTAIGFAGMWLLVSLLGKFPGRDIVQIGEEVAGPYINTLFATLYLLLIVFYSGILLRGFGERVVTGFLSDTPISLSVMSFMIGATVVSYLGLEAVARTARFLVMVLVIGIISLYLLTASFWDFNTMYPLLGAGLVDVVRGALYHTGDFIEILLLGIITPFIPHGGLRAIGTWGVLVAGFLMFLVVLIPLWVFSYPTVAELALPSFNLARIISIGRFGQRMEIVFLPVWVFANLIYLSTAIYAGAAVLVRMLKLSDYRPFTLSVSVLIVVVAFIPQNVAQAAYLYNQYLSRYSFGLLVIVLAVLYFIAWLKGKGGSKGVQGG